MTSIVERAQEGTYSGDDPLAGIRFVDCDAHFSEPPDLWSARMPATSKARVPQLKTVNGQSNWYLGDELFTSMGGNAIRRGRERIHGCLSSIQPFEDLDESAWSVPERVKFMDDIGVLAQIVYPNGIGFSSNYIFAMDNADEREAILRAYNDFYVDVQRESGGRVLPQCMLPIWDMEFTVAEMTRLLDQRMTGFTLSDRPELLGLPELSDPYFDPMWDLFNQSGTVANFHLAAGATKAELEVVRGMEAERGTDNRPAPKSPSGGAAPGWWSLPPQRRSCATTAQMFMSNARIVSNLCLSDIFDRFPNLKIMSAESGIGWIPFVLEALEYHFDDMVTDDGERRFAKRRPKEYFSDHIFVTFWFERLAPSKLLDDIGVNNIMVETDFPHPTCLYPETRKFIGETVAHLDEDTRRRILRDNAVELYGIDQSLM